MDGLAADEPSVVDDLRLPGVKTLGKALTLLDVVAAAEHPPTVSELALKAGLTRPTAHRLVQTLIASGFLQQNPLDNRLTIGFAVLPLASSLLDRNRLRLEALPHLQALAHKMNERVNLGILNRNRVLILAGSEAAPQLILDDDLSFRVIATSGRGRSSLDRVSAAEIVELWGAADLYDRIEAALRTAAGLKSRPTGAIVAGLGVAGDHGAKV